MSDDSIQKLKERYRRAREYAPGAAHPGEPFFDRDPEWFENYQKAWEFAAGQGKGLPIKTRELIMLAVNARLYPFPDRVRMHLRRALFHGATVEEVVDTAMSAWALSGPAPGWTILAALDALQREARQRGESFGKGKDWLRLSEVPAVES